MIPSTENKLLISEDWKKIYQSFKNADFKSYDFDTLRRTMISYIQENYPEDFNDFIDSSEYIALIDLIAYLGQNLSFRIDLNARENFLETAQRRDSILRLANLVSYNPKRNISASGILKVTSILTSDNVFDSNGVNLANSPIVWNDNTNPNWYQQFINVINSAMPESFIFGKPYDRKTINGVLTEQYRINSSNNNLPIFSFLKNINGTSMNFEIVPSTFFNSDTIYEETPKPKNTLSFVYKNDNQGAGSNNTGFFFLFKQGVLNFSNFSIDTPVSNEIIAINSSNINNDDVWLWQLSSNTQFDSEWKKISATIGNNIIYNSLNKNERKIFSVSTRDDDQIDLNFADGNFGDLPKGQFRVYYRQSNGLTYTIKADQFKGIVIEIPYFNKVGQVHTLSLTLSLQYTVNNSSPKESNESIQKNAPQAFYSQNRMVTAEDYNIVPLTISSEILKVKSINRISSGISKYYDIDDVSGKYSKTNIFAEDGIIYKNISNQILNFDFSNRNELFYAIKNRVEPILLMSDLKSFYYEKYERPILSDLNSSWTVVNSVSGQSRGYFKQIDNTSSNEIPLNLGNFTSNNFKYVTPGSLIKFIPPQGKYFNKNGKIVSVKPFENRDYIWSKVIQVIGDGSNTGQGALDDGTGPVILSSFVDSEAIPVEVIPKFIDILSSSFENEIIGLCLNQRNFGITINKLTREWSFISDVNLNIFDEFDLDTQGNKDNSNSDSSWLILFLWKDNRYDVNYRSIEYFFESEQETSFFTDGTSVNFDVVSRSIIKDKIKILSINYKNTSTSVSLGQDFTWEVEKSIVESDGYINPKKIKISFYDFNNSGYIENPDSFLNVVETETTSTTTGYKDKFIFFEKNNDTYQLVDNSLILSFPNELLVPLELKIDSQLYYFYDYDVNVVKEYSYQNEINQIDPWILKTQYIAYQGRSNLKFQYTHNSGENRRLDPSKTNIIDLYVLTSAYDNDYRNWLTTGLGTEPLAPTSQSLDQNYSSFLDSIKTISDEIIFQPVKYKVLFGPAAEKNLQATFKAVKNSAIPISDNEIKTKILSAINEFFSIENWDFGQSFYFSELSTFVMNKLTPNITNFVIIPKLNNSFGNLFEINCLGNEIFISGATVSDIQVIDALTAAQLNLI